MLRRILDEMKALAVVLVVVAAFGTSACASSHHGKSVAPMPGTVPSTRADVAIARVQSAEAAFRFFPNGTTSAGCLIPAGLMRIKGICRTRVRYPHGSQIAEVTFTESWPARKFRTAGPPRGILHHSWRFEVRAGGVVGLGDQGAFPPQMAD
jgi:hypothetical protein